MSFTINRKALEAELSLLQSVAEKKGTIPVLSTVLMKFEGDKLRLTASDCDVFLITEINAEGEPWAGCIPLAQLTAFIRLSDTEFITCSEKQGHAQISAGKSKITLPITDPVNFPDCAIDFGDDKIPIAGDALRSAVTRCLPCVMDMDEESRWVLQGVKIEIADGKLRTIATNGHGLGMAEMDAGAGSYMALVPERALRALIRTKSETVQIQGDENRICFQCDHRTIIARLIAGAFPNWEMILPKEMPYKTEMAGDDLKLALRRVNLARSETYKTGVGRILGSVVMNFQNDAVVIDTGISDRGRCEEPVAATSNLNGDTIPVGINPDYVMDFLSNAGERVVCELKDGNNVLRFTDGSNFQYVVMPMRI